MKKREISKQETQSIMAFVRTADILNRYLQIELAKSGSSPTRFAIMNALLVHGGTMTPTAISKWVFRAKHSITGILKALSEKGLIRRKPSHNDGRSVNIVITKKGWNATRKMLPVADEISKEVLSCFDDEQLETLTKLLKNFRKHLLKKLSENS